MISHVLRFGTLVACVFAAHNDSHSRTEASPSTLCQTWPGDGGMATLASLQIAVNANICVSIQAGTFNFEGQMGSEGITIPSNHTLTGAGQHETILKVDTATWKILRNGDSMISHIGWGPGQDTVGVTISNLTLDASGIATAGIIADGMTIIGVTIKNARCNGLDINGPGVILRNSFITGSARTVNIPGRGSVNCATLPDDDPRGYGGVQLGSAIYGEPVVYQGLSTRKLEPDIQFNIITNNIGPAIDINGVDGGTFGHNTVSDNTGWGGVGLYEAADWKLFNNVISHPQTDPSASYNEYVYHPGCAQLTGGKTAGIVLCYDNEAVNGTALTPLKGTLIYNNKASSHYGILLVGTGSSASPFFSPYGNSIQNNDVSESNVGCGDSFNPKWSTKGVPANNWLGNNCQGTLDSPPTYLN
jgi:hypothetical protein